MFSQLLNASHDARCKSRKVAPQSEENRVQCHCPFPSIDISLLCSWTMSPRPPWITHIFTSSINGVGSTQFAKQFKHQKSTAKMNAFFLPLNITGFCDFVTENLNLYTTHIHSSRRQYPPQQPYILQWIKPSINFPSFCSNWSELPFASKRNSVWIVFFFWFCEIYNNKQIYTIFRMSSRV